MLANIADSVSNAAVYYVIKTGARSPEFCMLTDDCSACRLSEAAGLDRCHPLSELQAIYSINP